MWYPRVKVLMLKSSSVLSTPLIDDQDDSRIRKEIDFNPRSFADGVKCLVDEVRKIDKQKKF